MPIPKDITGQKFGRLVVISKTDERQKRNVVWLCQCDCGKQHKTLKFCLTSGKVRSCGCLNKEQSIINGNANWTYLSKENSKINRAKACGEVRNTAVVQLSKKLSSNNKTGVKGVFWYNRRQKYVAKIEFMKKQYFLGYYNSLEEAAIVRKQAEEMMFEPFLEWYYEQFPDKKPKETA